MKKLGPLGIRFTPVLLIATLSFLILTHKDNASAKSDTIILSAISCRSESTLKSKSSLFSTNIQFINKHAFPVKVYWIDFSGKRQHYFDLAPNEVRWQQTFTSHPWIITESGANQPCLSVFMPPLFVNGVAIVD
jgi:hypothetical protein